MRFSSSTRESEYPKKINVLADMMLMVDGYNSLLSGDEGEEHYDFSTSTMLRCQKAWNKAVTAYSFLMKQPDMLRFQVTMTAENMFENSDN